MDSTGIKRVISAHCKHLMPIQPLREMEKFERQKLLKSLGHCRNVTNILTNKILGQEDLTVTSTKYLRKKQYQFYTLFQKIETEGVLTNSLCPALP